MDELKPEPQVDIAKTWSPRALLRAPARTLELSGLVNRALDQLDSIADRIANETGLR